MKKLYTFMAGIMACAIGVGSLTLNAVNYADAPEAMEADASSVTLVRTYPSNNATLAEWDFTKLVKFRFSGDIEINREGEAGVQVAIPSPFGGGFSVQETYPASDTENIYVNPFDSSELWINLSSYDFMLDKNYTIILQEGLVTSNGASNAECTTSFTLINSPKFTTIPASGTTVALASELENVTVSFASGGFTKMEYSETSEIQRPKVNLYKVDGASRTRVGSYNTVISDNTIELTYAGETPEMLESPAYYEIQIPSGFLTFRNGEDYAGASPLILITEIKCSTQTVEWANINEYITLSQPAYLEINPSNAGSTFATTGMSFIGLGLKTQDFFGLSNSAPITYTYYAAEGDEEELLDSVDPTDKDKIYFLGRGSADDSGLIDFPASYYMYIFFAADSEGDVDETAAAKYKRAGYYKLSIPDGAFMAEGKMLKGMDIVYHYSTEIPAQNFEYTLTPADGTELSNGAEVFGINGSGIILEFKDAKEIDTLNKPATLTCPDGTVLERVNPKTNFSNKLTWTFGLKDTQWPDGTYTFKVEKGKIGINMGWTDDWVGEGNFEGLTAVYTVNSSGVVGVAVIAGEAADSYTVYTLGGSKVKANVKAEALLDLEPGLYIINGKKALIRK